MLGKTNITTLAEGAIITEIEDYKWIQMQSGTYGDFVKAIYKNNYLVAIAANGVVAYTTDGEVWQASIPGYEDCKLNDIEWDGSRFILVGSFSDEGKRIGLILETRDFTEYTRISIENDNDSETSYDIEYCAVYPSNGKYIVCAKRFDHPYIYVYAYIGDLIDKWKIQNRLYAQNGTGTSRNYYTQKIAVAKNSTGMLLYVNYYATAGQYATWYDEIQKINNEGIFTFLYSSKNANTPRMNVYEGKDILFYESLSVDDNYRMVKVLDSNEQSILVTGQNFSFKDAVYFDGCQIFINNHELLVVKKGESIADKTVDDLREIAPELTMNSIEKAFGQLFVFGNHGAILKSSVETGNEEAIAVQTISAKKALADAKKYTDERCAVLEARIATLEGKN